MMRGIFAFVFLGIAVVESYDKKYKTKEKTFEVEALDKSDQHVHLYYPIGEDESVRFPFISYAHGLFGGNEIDINGYYDFFHQLASYGFVVGAPASCNTGCEDHLNAPYTDCAGGPLPISEFKGWNSYFGEQFKTIEWARNMSNSSIFNTIDWSVGVGIAGHSMGGQATTQSSHFECVKEWDIRASVIHHAAPCDVFETQNAGSNITNVPLASFTSSGDSCCEESTKKIYEAAKVKPKLYRDLKGWSHLEPVLIPPVENPKLVRACCCCPKKLSFHFFDT